MKDFAGTSSKPLKIWSNCREILDGVGIPFERAERMIPLGVRVCDPKRNQFSYTGNLMATKESQYYTEIFGRKFVYV